MEPARQITGLCALLFHADAASATDSFSVERARYLQQTDQIELARKEFRLALNHKPHDLWAHYVYGQLIDQEWMQTAVYEKQLNAWKTQQPDNPTPQRALTILTANIEYQPGPWCDDVDNMLTSLPKDPADQAVIWQRIANIRPKPSPLEGHRSAQTQFHGRLRQHQRLGFDRKQAPKSSKSAPRRSWPDRPSAWHPGLIEQSPAVVAPGMAARDRRGLAASPAEAPPLVSAWADHTSDIRTRPPRTPP